MTAARIISASGFKDTEVLISRQEGRYAELSSPNEKNQFIIIDLQKPRNILQVVLVIPAESRVREEELEVYSGENFLQWQKISGTVTKTAECYAAALEPNAGQYLKLVFGSKPRPAPLKISRIELINNNEAVSQSVLNVNVPEDKITSASVVIEYETERPSLTYVLYGTNFDYLYTNKLEHVYSDLTPKVRHRVVLTKLLPKVTYAYNIIAKDINEKQYSTRTMYFSTR